MGLCATPIWARKQLGTRVIEGVSKVEGVTGCAGWSLVYRLPDVPSADLHVPVRHAVRGGRTMGDVRWGGATRTMILPISHELNGFNRVVFFRTILYGPIPTVHLSLGYGS